MLTTEQKVNLLFNRYLGRQYITDQKHFNEPPLLTSEKREERLWLDNITGIAETLADEEFANGYQFFNKQLTRINNSIYSYTHANLKDVIKYPFADQSFNPRLYESDNVTEIPFDLWTIPEDGDMLLFVNTPPSDIIAGNLPYLHWYSYIGPKGVTGRFEGRQSNSLISPSTLNYTIPLASHMHPETRAWYMFGTNYTGFKNIINGVYAVPSGSYSVNEDSVDLTSSTSSMKIPYLDLDITSNFLYCIYFRIDVDWNTVSAVNIIRSDTINIRVYKDLSTLYTRVITLEVFLGSELFPIGKFVKQFVSQSQLHTEIIYGRDGSNNFYLYLNTRDTRDYITNVEHSYFPDPPNFPPNPAPDGTTITATTDLTVGYDPLYPTEDGRVRIYHIFKFNGDYDQFKDFRYMIYGPYPILIGNVHRTSVPAALNAIVRHVKKITPEPPTQIYEIGGYVENSYHAYAANGNIAEEPYLYLVTNDVNPICHFDPFDKRTMWYDGSWIQLISFYYEFDGSYHRLSIDIYINPESNQTYTRVRAYSVGTITDVDPYEGEPGKQGLYRTMQFSLGFRSGPYAGSNVTNEHYGVRLYHTRSTNAELRFIRFYIDDAGAGHGYPPTVTSASITSVPVHDGSTYRSGLPLLTSGQTLSVTFTPTNCVRKFYNFVRIATTSDPINETIVSTDTQYPSAFTQDNNTPVTQTCDISDIGFANNVTLTVTVYNSGDESGVDSGVVHGTYTSLRIDTLSVAVNENATRIYSGSGNYPNIGFSAGDHLLGLFGETYDSTELLTTAGVYELQLIGGKFRYPPLVDYSLAAHYPTGPNYSALVNDPVTGYRYVTFFLGNLSTATNEFTFTLNLFEGTPDTTILTNTSIHARLYNTGTTTAVTGWLDCNAGYPGSGNPVNNGDAALLVSDSSSSIKVITFGTTTRTGDLYIRIGMNGSATYALSSVSF